MSNNSKSGFEIRANLLLQAQGILEGNVQRENESVYSHNEIHPENKKDVGERLSFHSLKNEYGVNLVANGPLYREHISRNNYIEVVFDHSDNGFVASGNLNGFEVAGADRVFHSAQATIVKNKVRVFSNQVSKPIHVRYGWKNWFTGTLFNAEGLAASSFSSQQ